jgi:hypothetical protein
MKKNLTLLGILISLLVATYYIYEVGEQQDKIQKVQEKQLFKPNELGTMLSMSNVVVELESKGKHFYTRSPRLLVDDRKLDSFFNILSGVRAMRILKEEDLSEKRQKLMFPEGDKYKLSFEFEKGKLIFVFGEKLKFDQTFYLKVTWKPRKGEGSVRTVIAEDVSAAKGMYNKESYHLSDRKYKRLLTMLYLDAEFFYETRPFYNKTEMQLKRLAYLSQKQRPFTLNFLDSMTTPPPLAHDLDVHLEKIKQARLDWARLEATRVTSAELIKPEQKHLLKVLSSWSPQNGEEEQVELTIFRSIDEKEYWLKVQGQDKTFIFEKRPDVFFMALQDFWQKTPEFPQASRVVVQRGKKIDPKKASSFFAQEARAVDSLERWPLEDGEFWVSFSDSQDDSHIFDVYRVQNELHLRDNKRGIVYRYFQIPDWDKRLENKEKQ